MMEPGQSFTWQLPTKVVFGTGTVRKIGEQARALGGTRVLVVTDPVLRRVGPIEETRKYLEEAGLAVTIYDGVEPNPTIEVVEQGLTLAREFACDLLVGLGGGSSIDSAKAIGLMLNNAGSISDYWGRAPANRAVPVIAVPTTAGTASEVTWVTVIKDAKRKVKMGIGHPNLAAAVALCDPALSTTMPANVTASTGLDALTHAVESYTNTSTEPISEALALEAIRLIGANLRPAVAKGDNLSARERMLLASLMAGLAFANTRLGIVHAITSPLGGYFPVPHGVVNAILLPYAMEFNLIGHLEKHARIAAALGENVQGLSPVEAAGRSVEAVKKLAKDVGLPAGLGEVGVKEESLPEVCAEAMKNVNIPINPRRPTVEDLITICKKAM
ncbi:MAG TPA: iron-containing alcohol dehydrogenase [Firmicutes bacterium]|nr:iron-containing alcohol dehydrogenase [Bacillota bacterium]